MSASAQAPKSNGCGIVGAMKHQAFPRSRRAALVLALAAAFGSAYALPRAQAPAKKVLTIEDDARRFVRTFVLPGLTKGTHT